MDNIQDSAQDQADDDKNKKKKGAVVSALKVPGKIPVRQFDPANYVPKTPTDVASQRG